MAITYDASTNTLTVTDGTYDFADLYDADVAGGWGVVSKQGTSQYLLECFLYVGTTSDPITQVIDSGVQVQIGTEESQTGLYIYPYSVFQLGEKGSLSYGIGGTSFTLWMGTRIVSTGAVNLYGVSFYYPCASFNFKPRLIDFDNVIFDGVGTLWFENTSGNLRRSTWRSQNYYGLMLYTSNLVIEDTVLLCTANNGNSTNPVIRGCVCDDALSVHMRAASAGVITWTIIDCDYDIYKLQMNYTNYLNQVMNDYKTYRLRVTDESGTAIEGATVTITNAQGTEIVETTDVNGDITSQELHSFEARNNGTSGVGIDHTDYIFHTPFTIKVSKDLYSTYTYVVDLLRDDNKKGVAHAVSIKLAPVLNDPTKVFYRKEIQGGCCD